jgi:hypothetical protein
VTISAIARVLSPERSDVTDSHVTDSHVTHTYVTDNRVIDTLLKPLRLSSSSFSRVKAQSVAYLTGGGEGLFGDRAAYSATLFTMPVSGVNDTRVRLVGK